MTDLPIKADDKGRLRLVSCPVLLCEVDVRKCYRCVSYGGQASPIAYGATRGIGLVVCGYRKSKE